MNSRIVNSISLNKVINSNNNIREGLNLSNISNSTIIKECNEKSINVKSEYNNNESYIEENNCNEAQINNYKSNSNDEHTKRKESIYNTSFSSSCHNDSNDSNNTVNTYRTEDKISDYSFIIKNDPSKIEKSLNNIYSKNTDNNEILIKDTKKQVPLILATTNKQTPNASKTIKLLGKKRINLRKLTSKEDSEIEEEVSEEKEVSSSDSNSSDYEDDESEESISDQVIKKRKQKLKELINSMFFLKINTPAASGLKTIHTKLMELSKLLDQLSQETDIYKNLNQLIPQLNNFLSYKNEEVIILLTKVFDQIKSNVVFSLFEKPIDPKTIIKYRQAPTFKEVKKDLLSELDVIENDNSNNDLTMRESRRESVTQSNISIKRTNTNNKIKEESHNELKKNTHSFEKSTSSTNRTTSGIGEKKRRPANKEKEFIKEGGRDNKDKIDNNASKLNSYCDEESTMDSRIKAIPFNEKQLNNFIKKAYELFKISDTSNVNSSSDHSQNNILLKEDNNISNNNINNISSKSSFNTPLLPIKTKSSLKNISKSDSSSNNQEQSLFYLNKLKKHEIEYLNILLNSNTTTSTGNSNYNITKNSVIPDSLFSTIAELSYSKAIRQMLLRNICIKLYKPLNKICGKLLSQNEIKLLILELESQARMKDPSMGILYKNLICKLIRLIKEEVYKVYREFLQKMIAEA